MKYLPFLGQLQLHLGPLALLFNDVLGTVIKVVVPKSSILRLTQQHIGFSGSEQSQEQSECEVQLVHFAQSPHLLHLSAQLSLVNFALRYLSCNLVARLHSIAQM